MKTLKLIFTVLVVVTFIGLGCGKPQPFNTVDSDNDKIDDTYDNPDNPVTKQISCTQADGTVKFLDCSQTADCNCNNIPDNEEPETTSKCPFYECVPAGVKWAAGLGLGLVGGYIAGKQLNWFQGYGPDITVEEINWGSSSLTFKSADMTMNMKIVGECKSGSHKDYCEFEMAADVITPSAEGHWVNNYLSDPTKSFSLAIPNLKYRYNLKESPITGKEKNFIKVKGTNENGEKVEYVLKSPSWLGITTKADEANENVIAVTYFSKLLQGPPKEYIWDEPQVLAIGSEESSRVVFFQTTAPVSNLNKYYIFDTLWKRIDVPSGLILPSEFGSAIPEGLDDFLVKMIH